MNHPRTIDHRYAPNQQWTALCHPDDSHKTLIRDDGALLYNPVHWKGFARLFYPGIESRRGVLKITQRTESPEFPCVETRMEYPQAWLTLRTFATRDERGNRTDVVLWTIEVKPSVRDLKASFRLTAEVPQESLVLDPDGHRLLAGPKKVDAEAQKSEAGQKQALALFFPDKMVSKNTDLEGLVRFHLGTEGKLLQGGETVSGAWLLPQQHDSLEGYSYEWALQALERERAFWKKWAKDHVALSIPDPAVQDMIVSCARNIYQAREIRNGLPEFQVGAAVYRGLWVVDGHFILEAAHFIGCGKDAQTGWDALLRRVKPSGAIAEIEDHLKETSIALATFVRQTELSNDWERLRATWQIMLNALGYIRSLRDKAAAAPPDSPEFHLMPPCLADGGLAGERAELTTTLWTLFGLKEAAKAARQLSFSEDALSFQKEFDSLLADFKRVAKKYQQKLPDGTPYVSMCLPGSGDHCRTPNYKGEVPPWAKINSGTATWAYAQAIYPGQVLEARDPLVDNFTHMLDLIDDEQGIPANTGGLTLQGVWTYAASFYAHVWLYAGHPAKAVDYLYSYANHSSPTRVWREEQPLNSSESSELIGDMPHNWASAEFIRLVRNLLVFERGDDLELLYGLPPEWFPTDERPLLLPGSPTRFGPVSLSLHREKEEAVLRVECASVWSVKPKQVRLRVPGTADQVVMNGEKARVPENRILLLPARAEIRLKLPVTQ